MGKEGRDAVENILNTFGVLDKNYNSNNISNDKILKIEKNNESCLVTLDKNNCQVTLNVSIINEIIHFVYFIISQEIKLFQKL